MTSKKDTGLVFCAKPKVGNVSALDGSNAEERFTASGDPRGIDYHRINSCLKI